MTPDEQIAVIRARAEGKKIEFFEKSLMGATLNQVMHGDFDFQNYDYRIAPSPIASGHNPDKLTVEQVGEGWRLLSEEEVGARKEVDEPSSHIQQWWNTEWCTKLPFVGHNTNTTYRTQKPEGYFLPKKKVKVEGWMNVYGENWFAIHNTKNRADTHADSNRIACKHIVFEVTEGEGLEGGRDEAN